MKRQINSKSWCCCSSGLKLEHCNDTQEWISLLYRLWLTQAGKSLTCEVWLTSANSCGESCFEGIPNAAAEPHRWWRCCFSAMVWTQIPEARLGPHMSYVSWYTFVCFPLMWPKWNVDRISLEESGGDKRCFMRVKVCVEEKGGGVSDRTLGQGRIKARMKLLNGETGGLIWCPICGPQMPPLPTAPQCLDFKGISSSIVLGRRNRDPLKEWTLYVYLHSNWN